ncbi:MAG: ATP-binding protein [Acidobacteriota bacterium]
MADTPVPSRSRWPPGRIFSHERSIWLLVLLTGFPATAVALFLIWGEGGSREGQWLATLVLLTLWIGLAGTVRRRVAYPLQTLANLLEALREGDFSLRARRGRDDDALGEVMREVNLLGRTLQDQRMKALEASALLRRVMVEIDLAVFTFDGEHRLRLVNRAGERLLGAPEERLLGKTASELALAQFLDGDAARTVRAGFAGGEGQWGLRRSTFREGGVPHQLVVLTDLSRTLREEERQAWQRLIRVLGHELNNSLAPIKSMAGTLRTHALRTPRADDWEEDLGAGLRLIEDRSDALGRFIGAYSQLARLPRPKPVPLAVDDWVRRVVALEPRLRAEIEGGPHVILRADSDQLDQLLINLLRNAIDASLETGGGVRLGWSAVYTGVGRGARPGVEVWIEDDGPGLPNTSNLFVPFFTTKPGGTGIGLLLSRQIAEAHGGTLTLVNREGERGCRAVLWLPLVPA